MPINAGDMQNKDPASWLQWSSGKDKEKYAEPQRSVAAQWDRKQKSPAKRRTNQLRRKRIRQPIPQRRRAEARSSSASVGNGGYSSPGWRSEEHTSELQSLMRNSYAVFSLKKTKSHTMSHSQVVYICSQQPHY